MGDYEPRFKTLVDIYHHARDNYSDRPALAVKSDGDWRWLTFAELVERVEAMRGGLASLGVGRGDRVAIISTNRPEWAVAAYAAYGLGAVFVPMYQSQRPEDWRYIIDDSGSKVVFVSDEATRDEVMGFADQVESLETVVVIDGKGPDLAFDELLSRGVDAPAGIVNVDPKETAGFIYTSGTTGRPKGVVLSHQNIAGNVSVMADIIPLEPDDLAISYLPWAHSMGQVTELHVAIALGARSAIAESVERLGDNIREVRPTLLPGVPAVYNRAYHAIRNSATESGGLKKWLFEAALANAARRRRRLQEDRSGGMADTMHKVFDRLVFEKVRAGLGGRVRMAYCGSAALSPEVINFFDDVGIPIYEGYGLTETSPTVSVNHPGARRVGSVGKVHPGVEVSIDPVEGEDPRVGEVIVYGHGVMQGYHRLPDETAQVMTVDGGLRTGDLGYLDDDGFLFITGRLKEQFKLDNGKYVAPAAIEEQLKLAPLIGQALIFGENRSHIVALIVPDFDALGLWAAAEGIEVSDRESLVGDSRVRELFRAEVEAYSTEAKRYERVRDFVLAVDDFRVDNGLLTPTLKLKRKAVLEQYLEQLEKLYGD